VLVEKAAAGLEIRVEAGRQGDAFGLGITSVIVLDSSAIVAILSRASGYESLLTTVTSTDRCALSALTFFEVALVLFAREREAGLQDLAVKVDFAGAE
jgi:hypothetical protein